MSSRYGLQAGDLLRSCTFVDLVKCRGLVAAVVGCAETCCAEAETRCAEAFAGGGGGASVFAGGAPVLAGGAALPALPFPEASAGGSGGGGGAPVGGGGGPPAGGVGSAASIQHVSDEIDHKKSEVPYPA